MDSSAVVPTKSSPRLDGRAHRERSLVERRAGRLEEKRRPATRYEKPAGGRLATLHLAAILMWIRRTQPRRTRH